MSSPIQPTTSASGNNVASDQATSLESNRFGIANQTDRVPFEPEVFAKMVEKYGKIAEDLKKECPPESES
ncbi:hypothetical protein IAU59_000670 [Kwoniella sp. CBS 9459]